MKKHCGGEVGWGRGVKIKLTNGFPDPENL